MRGIADDDFNIGMAQTSEEKDEFIKAKASKTWRTLRLATRTKLGLLDMMAKVSRPYLMFQHPSLPRRRTQRQRRPLAKWQRDPMKPPKK
jgi:THO complex subunit 1